MKFSKVWLEEQLNQTISNDILTHQLTMAGLEVDAVESVAADFTHIKVGEVVECGPHPDADKLQVTQVNVGDAENLQIVCGAKNCRKGLKVACAVLGAVLPGDFKIKKAKLRGVESNGMLCSTSELGISEESDGILELPDDAPIGADIREYLQLDDTAIEIDLTANRGDCLSLLGLAREVSTINNWNMLDRVVKPLSTPSLRTRNARVCNFTACPKYLGRVVEGIDPDAKTPLWMQERLRRSDIRSIHPVVDVTNYVMLLLGQPMHAFDDDCLTGWVDVRYAREGETLTLLDGSDVTLNQAQLLIADEKGPLAIAGVIGGLKPSVTDKTVNVFLESAFFAPAAIRGQARKLGLNTDSAHRFERGVDPVVTEEALELATRLLIEIAGGEPGPVCASVSELELPQPAHIELRLPRLTKLLGAEFEKDKVIQVLRGLGCEVTDNGEILTVSTPSWRFDLSIEVDLIEEVARIIGFEQIEATMPAINLTGEFDYSETELEARDLKSILVSRDYCEAITYSFIDPKAHAAVSKEEPLVLGNALSQDLSVMRSTLLPGLLTTISHNLKRQNERLRFFEQGRVFVDDQEVERISAIICGPLYDVNPHGNRPVSFYDLKADLEALLGWPADLNDEYEIDFLHPGQSALVTLGGELMGWIGQVHPSVTKAFKIKQKVFAFELDMRLLRERDIPQFEVFSKYPSIKRDIALVLDEEIQAEQVLVCVEEAAGETLQSVKVFDEYKGDNIENHQKSLALTLILQSLSHTLTEDEVAATMAKVLSELQQSFGAELRE